MLEKQYHKKIRKNNLYVLVDRFRITNLHLDLWSSKIFIDVEFYKENRLIHIKSFEMAELFGDTDVNKMIDELVIYLENGYGQPPL